MKWSVSFGGVCWALMIASGLQAQAPTPVHEVVPVAAGPRCCPPVAVPDCCRPPSPISPAPGEPGPGPSPMVPPTGAEPSQPPAAAPGEAFAQPGAGGTQPAAMFDAGMFGDVSPTSRLGNFAILVPRGSLPGQVPPVSGNRLYVTAPLPERASFKISENESPRPVDRIFVTYNYYNNVDKLDFASSRADLHREMIGFEKTFLNGDASFGMRLPFVQLTGSSDFQDTHIDDLSMIFKFAVINDRVTGNVLSGGLVLTAPTGEEVKVNGESTIHSTVFQPWVGFVYYANRDLYVEGFSSVAAPTDARDVTIFFNSLAVGYHLYRNPDRDGLLQQVVPDVELHVNTPLNHRGWATEPLGFPDAVDFTGGCHFVLRRAVAGIAFGTPVTGPKPFEFEVLANLNIRF